MSDRLAPTLVSDQRWQFGISMGQGANDVKVEKIWKDHRHTHGSLLTTRIWYSIGDSAPRPIDTCILYSKLRVDKLRAPDRIYDLYNFIYCLWPGYKINTAWSVTWPKFWGPFSHQFTNYYLASKPIQRVTMVIKANGVRWGLAICH